MNLLSVSQDFMNMDATGVQVNLFERIDTKGLILLSFFDLI